MQKNEQEKVLSKVWSEDMGPAIIIRNNSE